MTMQQSLDRTEREDVAYIPAYYQEQGITAANCNADDPQEAQERDEAREAVAARLERLARRVRQSPVTEVAKFDAAYSLIVKLAAQIMPLLA